MTDFPSAKPVKQLLMIQSIPSHQWSMVEVVLWGSTVKLVSLYLLMMWLLSKAAGGILKTRALLSAQIQPNASKLIGRYFLMFFNGQVNHLTLVESIVISLTEGKTEGKMSQEQAGSKDSCSKGLAEYHPGRNSVSGDGIQLSKSHLQIGREHVLTPVTV